MKGKPLALNRRTVLGVPLLLATPAFGAENSLQSDVVTYVGLGNHRAGTAGERKTIRWLDQRLTRLGYRTEKQQVQISTLFDPGGTVIAGDVEAALFPQWLPPANALAKTVTAPLIALGAPGGPPSIRLLTSPAKLTANWGTALSAYVQEATAKGAHALVMALNDPSDDLFVCNQHSAEPFPIPVMLTARRNLAPLGLVLGQSAKLRVTGKMAKAHALNIFARKPGVGSTIVISTPLTGWFRCGGERGPGIALWLRMAAMLARSKQPVLMLGTGSHEIGHLGMEHALTHGTPKPDDVALWIHFGASLAATKLDQRYQYKTGQYLVGTETTAALARERLGAVMPTYVPGDGKTLGEAGQVIAAGHKRFIGMSGQFPTFHTPLDGGEAIDFDHLERIARASETVLTQM